MEEIVIDTDGTKSWFLDGVRHRIGAPAIEFAIGVDCWFMNGRPHREDGPAIDYNDRGLRSWYLNGIKLPVEEIEQWITDNDIVVPFDESNIMMFKMRWL